MREVNLSGLDLNLLPPLEALLRQRNVTYAANDVGLSQPAMSRAFARLRATLNDPLLVRASSGYVLTPRAQLIAAKLGAALAAVREVYRPSQFDPAIEQRVVRIAGADIQTILILPPLMARLAREAPGIDIRVESYSADMVSRMESGQLDFAFAIASTPLPPGACSVALAKDELTLTMRRSHPMARKTWSLQDYAAHEHAAISLLGDGQSETDAVLAAAGLKRRISLVTPHFMAALAAVSQTDLITTLSKALIKRFADQFDLIQKTPPLPHNTIDITLVWSGIRDADPVLIWLRTVIQEVAAKVYAA